MNSKIEKIIKDLYALDPELARHDTHIRKLVAEIMKLKPEVVVDEAFRKHLRMQLMDKIEQARVGEESSLIRRLFSMTALKYTAGALAVVALAVLGTVTYLSQDQQMPNLAGLLQITPTVESIGDHAFGDMTSVGLGGFGGGGGGAGGSENLAVETPKTTEGYGIGGGGGGSDIYIPRIYRYTYTGDEIELSDSKVSVLKRSTGAPVRNSLTDLLKQSDIGLADLDSFGGAGLQAFMLTQEEPYGYMINVDLQNGQININQNWTQWPDLPPLCYGLGCVGGQAGLSLSDVPSDDAVKAIADQFMSQHGVNTSDYGQPKVMDDWRRAYELAQDKSQVWIPDTLTVVYPLIIDGEEVIDEAGNPSGIYVGVNFRYSRVTGVWNLMSQTYQSSSYTAVTDVQRIVDVAEKGGLFYWTSEDQNVQYIDVDLGTPRKGLAKMWYQVDGSKQGSEILVPSLIFPVLNPPADEPYFRTQIVVPLVKEILDRQQDPVRTLQ